MALHAWSSAKYSFPLPEGHRFPIAKYARLRNRVIADGIVEAERLHDPAPAGREDLLLVHSADYVDRFTDGRLLILYDDQPAGAPLTFVENWAAKLRGR